MASKRIKVSYALPTPYGFPMLCIVHQKISKSVEMNIYSYIFKYNKQDTRFKKKNPYLTFV